MRRLAPLALIGALAVTACGPVTVEQAERSCLDDARSAKGPRGSVAIGAGGSRHGISPYGRVEMSVSSDYIFGRDPAEVFTNCVMRRSGQMPTRSLADQPGWKG
ncbi:MAG: hypothetical protein Q4G24_08680 [Paracoccus sp. (in: a-proteobacteria)]|uniref:hypothetical protein n=1 Tax=Paracoccus sp. TaxID=267 RepID=UPI0026E0412E|nr:hypothetical protein [Paracoccus sp. (in: a-proteobacteria)]MDO5621529.1 hypothetical protein [Paracoccus sp. (in: a-proteobacteria)]